jgi:hypothetical protein
MYEDPGAATAAPESVIDWFKQQVVEHHLVQKAAEKAGDKIEAASNPEKSFSQKESDSTSSKEALSEQDSIERLNRSDRGGNIAIIDGKEVDILEYIYRRRLRQEGE